MGVINEDNNTHVVCIAGDAMLASSEKGELLVQGVQSGCHSAKNKSGRYWHVSRGVENWRVSITVAIFWYMDRSIFCNFRCYYCNYLTYFTNYTINV